MTPSSPSDESLGVLIVEDHKDTREMVALMVRGMGYSLSTAGTGKEAVQRLREHPVDLVLLDLLMPEMDGFEFCRVVRASAAVRDLPYIIITSARDALEDKVKGLVDLRADDYVTKPFSLMELQARIKVGERIVRAIKGLIKGQAELDRLACEDALTGLDNLRGFAEHAEKECLRARRYHHPLSLLLADLDHFKTLNDTYGHGFGDPVLKEVGQALVRHCRTNDLCARYGGEEFTILLPETALPKAGKVAGRLCRAVRHLAFSHPSGLIRITMSFGVAAVGHDQPWTLDELLEQADQALNAAKHKGRNRVELYPVTQ